MKNYIKDNGKIKWCEKNIVQMNTYEYIKHSPNKWYHYVFPVNMTLDDLKGLLVVLAYITQIIPFMWLIIAIINSYFELRSRKKKYYNNPLNFKNNL